LESALNAGDRSSIGILNSDPLRNGVTLALSDFWVGFADFYFDTPTVSDSAQATQRFEYRARYEGWAAFNLTIDATSARLATLKLKQKLHTLGALADPAAQSHIATATNAGSITYTDGT
jgi:hypothetical protein